MAQQISSKEQTLFRQLVKFYEAKQHKKALKTADQILKKNPDYADAIAMKALTLNATGQTDEAFALAKVALQKSGMKSHICWHVYGLLYRSVKNLEEAIKAYKFALKLEPDSHQIQRDLAYLQIQMRDYHGYIQSRKAMLQQKPALRQNWTALAVAYHLADELATAEEMLTTYEGTLKTPPPRNDIEHSEACLYRNSIIAETGQTERALEHLDTIYKSNLDRTAVMEARAQYLLVLDRKEEAETAYRALLDRNNEYRLYYEQLEKALGLDRSNPQHAQKLVDLYESFTSNNDRSDAARRIPLDFLSGDQFKAAADRYLRRMLTKGVPSTFPNMKMLYSDPTKLEVIQTLVEEGYDLDADEADETDEKLANGDIAKRFEKARLFFLAQHYDYHASRNLEKAMQYVDQVIDLDPKSVDYHRQKARILKHYGDSAKAAETMNSARELDLKDRYINTKCAKYQLRNNQNEIAIQTMSKFTRNETAGGALGDLHDMQCMWYITEDGEAYMRQGKLGLALKRFKAAYDIFETWQEDQFDFHHFSLRKGQIRAYIDMMRWGDRLREHPFYTRAALDAVKVYIMLHDDPSLAHGAMPNGTADLANLGAGERKKALKKAKREQERQQQKQEMERREAEKKQAAGGVSKGKGADGEVKKEDPDPKGQQLVETKTPLDDALKYLVPMLEMSPKNIEAQNVGFELFIRRKKHLLSLKCLIAAHNIDASDPTFHYQVARFRQILDSLPNSHPDPKMEQVLKSCATNIVPASSDLPSWNDSYLSKHKDSAPHVQAVLRVRQLLDPTSKAENEADLLRSLDLQDIGIKEAEGGLDLLKEWKTESDVREKYLAAAIKRWPQATVFKKG